MNSLQTNGNAASGNGLEGVVKEPSLNSLLPEGVSLLGDAVSESDRDMVLMLIAQIREQLPLRSLKAKERRRSAGMGDQNRLFVRKVIEVLNQNADFLPRSFDVDKLRQDMESFERMDSILMAINQLRCFGGCDCYQSGQ